MRAWLTLGLLVYSLTAHAASPIATVEAFQKAMAAGDRQGMESALHPDVLIYEGGHVESSRAEYARHHMDADIAFGKSATVQVLKRVQTQEGDMAIVTTETKTTASQAATPVVYMGTETLVLKRSASGWQIVHVHWSSYKRK